MKYSVLETGTIRRTKKEKMKPFYFCEEFYFC
jgi:hypothetical protein